ncbi:hypothetical protein OQG81_03535 [Streptococcus macedonicus]|uniref:Uncharacterized protein n=1 Tax=Streptococcus macedonicus TaxID=59310 RepID=A0AA47FFV0_STRMC|nr:hypothetical protein [Streptococcus macedonicus]WAK63934.1 hypothetical protein OQG81_03535 [Streptococcus macedonicus]
MANLPALLNGFNTNLKMLNDLRLSNNLLKEVDAIIIGTDPDHREEESQLLIEFLELIQVH